MWNDKVKEKLLIQKRAHLLEEFKLKIWSREEYIEKLDGASRWPSCQTPEGSCRFS
jgi:hypothetical protein